MTLRTTAISQVLQEFLKALMFGHLWKNIVKGINKIFVSDQQDTDYLTFDSSKLNEGYAWVHHRK